MDYNVQSNIKKTVFSDIKEITNTNVDWNRFNGKTVLITGAGGFIGYYLVLTFLARNDFYNNNIKILAFVRNREPRKSLAFFLKEMTLSLLLPMLQIRLNVRERILLFMPQVRQVIFNLKPIL